MLLSIDTRNNKAFMLSVPRDFYVNIPGNGYAKINEAYPDGQTEKFSEAGYPKGGMGLLEKTVSEDFGLPIHYHALINYTAFRDAVNAIGGVKVDIQSENPNGLYDPSIDWTTHGPMVKLSNGWHTLTGQQALDLARARGDAYGSYGFPQADFDRTAHQRQLLTALKSKTSSAGVIANPIKLGQLFDALGKNVHTDFKTGEIRRLYDISKLIKESSIQSVSLNDASGHNLLANQTSPTGQSILVPAAGIGDYSQIKLFIKKLTSNDPIVKEGANIVVLNGSDIDGLASKEKTKLTDKNFNVAAVANTTHSDKTSIIDTSKGKKPATLAALKKLYGNNVSTTNTLGYPTADFIIVLGSDQKQSTQ
jgi:LCP family protein required for cell wall assembly